MGWAVRRSNPGEGEIFCTRPASYKMGTGSFPGVKRPRPGFDQSHLLTPRLKKEWSYTSTPYLELHGLF